MSTMVVTNIPAGETVNLRRGPSLSSVVLVRVPRGETVDATPYDGTWSCACYGSARGYMMTRYLAAPDACPEDSSANDAPFAASADGVIRGTGVRVRAEPGTSAAILAYVNTGDAVIYDADATYCASGYLWYRCTGARWSGIGYIASDYVVPASNASGGVSYAYSAADAVAYAMNHSDNSSGQCAKYNTVFTSIDGSDDCADFVSQCLCAGGAPMFDGWFFRLPGIPSIWTDSKWFVTYSGLQRLLAKGWLSEVSCDAVQPGDIIYTYNPSATPTPYTHVSIAVSANVEQSGRPGCRVCSYTTNRRDAFKALTAATCRCYRVKETLAGNGKEKRVLLPLSGNGATVQAG